MKLTENQRIALRYLDRFGGMHPSSHMRTAACPNPGPLLARLEKRGFVEGGINYPPEGKCYQITESGRAALRDATKEPPQ